jgi:hypothetical protein
MLRLLTMLSLLAAAVIAVACDPFNPDLGDTPYRCATSEPKCPDGYEAVDVPQPILCECRLPGTDGNQPDASTMDCSDDGSEPNDLIQNARMTPIGTGSQTAQFPNQAICSVSDVDTYRLMSSQPNQKLTATLQFNMSIGQLNISVLDGNGTRIEMEPMVMGNMLVLKVPLVTQGAYFVRVGSSAGTNTYGLSLLVQ